MSTTSVRRITASSYWRIPPGFVPVRTSLGLPKGMTLPDLRSAAPMKAMWGSDTFADDYRALLARRSNKLLPVLDDLLESYGDLTMCCYEADPNDCHRTDLLGWLADHGYTVVPEVAR